MNNSRPLDENGVRPNYQNLKTQCFFKLQQYIKKIRINNERYKEQIVKELDAIVEIDLDKDGKKKIISKDKLKDQL